MTAVRDAGLARAVGAEQLQAVALANVANAVLIADVDGTIVWVNAAFTRLSGHALEEAVGKTPRLLKSGEQDGSFYEQLWSTILAGQAWRGEVVNRHRDGHLYRVLQTITPIVGEGGDITAFVAVHEDITELRSNQARLQALFDHALDAIVLFDGTGRCVSANPAVCDLTGYTADELTLMSLQDLVAADATATFGVYWDRLFAEGQARGEMQVVRSDGQRRVVEFQAVTDVVPEVHLLIARDVTEHRRVQDGYRSQAQLLDAVGDAVIATDLDGVVQYWGPAAEALYGYKADEVLGHPIVQLNMPDRAAPDAAQVMAQVSSGQTWTGEFMVRRHDGTTFPALVTDAPYRDAEGDVVGIIGVSTDITELKDAQARLQQHARQQELIASLGRRLLAADDARDVSLQAQEVLDSGQDVLPGPVRVCRPDDLCPPTASTPALRGLSVPAGRAGALIFAETTPESVSAQDQQFLGALAQLLELAVDREQARDRIEHQAAHDVVTGLPNRTLLLDRLDQARAASQRTGTSYLVAFLDLDGFKFVNDGLGHETGDDVLRFAAERLHGALRPADTVARVGGDEFVVLCPGVDDVVVATDIAQRLQQELGEPLASERGDLAITASIGLVLGDHAADGATLLRQADTAMYRAKAHGRGTIRFFDDEMHLETLQRLDMTRHLRHALANDGIQVLYQPTVDLRTGRTVGVEALARLHLPDGRIIPPDEFIPVAEHTGLIIPLGEYVIRRACEDAAAWLTVQSDFTIAVNISSRQLANPETCGNIKHVLDNTSMPAERLMLELTESAALGQHSVAACMWQLRQLGVHFAIDDFGTGYSSLAYLRNMPASQLKIDRSFVSGVTTSAHDRALVAASIDLARQFSLSTTAEGIETEEQANELRRLGCVLGQGYLWSRPVTATTITAMLATIH